MQKTDRFIIKLIAIAHSKPQLPVFRNTHLPSFRSYPTTLLVFICLCLIVVAPVYAGCQQPKCCEDPRTQYPAPPPC